MASIPEQTDQVAMAPTPVQRGTLCPGLTKEGSLQHTSQEVLLGKNGPRVHEHCTHSTWTELRTEPMHRKGAETTHNEKFLKGP
jgi:IS5 family transposase